jgi:hypothetical protein
MNRQNNDFDLVESVMRNQIDNEKYGRKYNNGDRITSNERNYNYTTSDYLANNIGEQDFIDATINRDRAYRNIDYQRRWLDNNFRNPNFNGLVLPDGETKQIRDQNYFNAVIKNDILREQANKRINDKYSPQFIQDGYFSSMWYDGDTIGNESIYNLTKKKRQEALDRQKALTSQFEFDVKESTGQESFTKGLKLAELKQNKARYDAYHGLREEHPFDDQLERNRFVDSKFFKLLTPARQRDELRKRDIKLLKLLKLYLEDPAIPQADREEILNLAENVFVDDIVRGPRVEQVPRAYNHGNTRYQTNMFRDDIVSPVNTRVHNNSNARYQNNLFKDDIIENKIWKDVKKVIKKKPSKSNKKEIYEILEKVTKPIETINPAFGKRKTVKNNNKNELAKIEALRVVEDLLKNNVTARDEISKLYAKEKKSIKSSNKRLKEPKIKDIYETPIESFAKKYKHKEDYKKVYGLTNKEKLQKLEDEGLEMLNQAKKEFEEVNKKKLGKGSNGTDINPEYFANMSLNNPEFKELRKQALKRVAKKKKTIKKEVKGRKKDIYNAKLHNASPEVITATNAILKKLNKK